MDIKSARLKRGFSRREVCEWLEIPLRTLENWETGQRKCPVYVENLIIEKILRDSPQEDSHESIREITVLRIDICKNNLYRILPL